MKFLIALALIILMQSPAYSQAITVLVDSEDVVRANLVKNENGFVREVRTPSTNFVYLNENGERVELDYKIKGVLDERTFEKKHKLIARFGPMVLGLVLGKLFN